MKTLNRHELLNRHQLADRLGVSYSTVRRYCAAGILPRRTVPGNQVWYHWPEVKRALKRAGYDLPSNQ